MERQWEKQSTRREHKPPIVAIASSPPTTFPCVSNAWAHAPQLAQLAQLASSSFAATMQIRLQTLLTMYTMITSSATDAAWLACSSCLSRHEQVVYTCDRHLKPQRLAQICTSSSCCSAAAALLMLVEGQQDPNNAYNAWPPSCSCKLFMALATKVASSALAIAAVTVPVCGGT